MKAPWNCGLLIVFSLLAYGPMPGILVSASEALLDVRASSGAAASTSHAGSARMASADVSQNPLRLAANSAKESRGNGSETRVDISQYVLMHENRDRPAAGRRAGKSNSCSE